MASSRTILCLLAGLAVGAGCSRHSEQNAVARAATDLHSVEDNRSAPSVSSAQQTVTQVAADRTPSGPPRDLNVLFITVDSLRADMPWSGYERPIAPRLTELEQRAVSYTRAYAMSSYTSMSIGGLLGGRYPGEMKRDGYFFGTYRDNVMFPKRLQDAGIRTMTVQAHLYFRKGASGFEQGFDVYEVVPGLTWNATTDENVTSAKSVREGERILSNPANTSGRFFAWIHMMDPHDQYRSHAEVPSWGRKARDIYDNEVAYTDMHIGMLLDFVAKQPWADRTAIVISADHGEAFGEHGMFRHGFELWEPLVRVPLMFIIPGAKPHRIDLARSHLDLAPTILDLFRVAQDGMEGRSLVPEIYGLATPEPRDVVIDLPRTSDSDRRRAFVHGQYKLIASGDDTSLQVFDLDADPDEKKSIVKSDTGMFKEMVARYKEAEKEIRDIGPYACRKLKGAPEGRAH